MRHGGNAQARCNPGRRRCRLRPTSRGGRGSHLARLRDLRSNLIDPAIAAHHARVAKRTADGICSTSTRQLLHWDRLRDDHIMAECGLPAGPSPALGDRPQHSAMPWAALTPTRTCGQSRGGQSKQPGTPCARTSLRPECARWCAPASPTQPRRRGRSGSCPDAPLGPRRSG